MNTERQRRVIQVLGDVLEREPGERAAALARACGGDQVLIEEVGRLLAREKRAAAFLEESPLGVAARAQADESESLVGTHVGAYRVVREIGRGGMGAVFEAARDDQEFEKRVAVKLIKRGMDSDAILQRFRNERQILASLDHPNIARLIDGGTTEDGLPYLVMEFVEGLPVDKYADAQGLSTADRLRLFRTVCAAVSYAHRNQVIHRDIKPSNILVTPEGTPKLLDFGIAKLLDARQGAHETATALRVMTPEYASPEQVRGKPVTTATDIYALGVLLYELLTGHRPYRFKSRSPEDVARAVCEQEPERPSESISDFGSRNADSTGGSSNPKSAARSQKSLRGDLDNIVLLALRKEPERRYASVSEFSEDIRRHLDGLPVRARRDTFAYRGAKFVRRHKIGVAAAALVLLSLAGGMTATAWQALKARSERARAEVEREVAERRFNEVRRLAHSLIFDYHDDIAKLPGSTPLRARLVKDALEYLNNLERDSAGDASLQREIADAYEKTGKVQGNDYYSNLGDTDGALKSYRKSLEIRERLALSDPNNRELQVELAGSYEGTGDLLYQTSDLRGALACYDSAVGIFQKLLANDPSNTGYRRGLSGLYLKIGDLKGNDYYSNLGDTVGAAQSYDSAVRLREALVSSEPDNPKLREELANALSSAGLIDGIKGDVRGAVEKGRRAADLLEPLVAAEPNNYGYRINLLTAYARLRFALEDDGQFAEAIGNMRRIIGMLEAMSATDPQNKNYRRNLSVSYNALGAELLANGDVTGALMNHRKALEIVSTLSSSDPHNPEHRQDLASTLQRLGEAQAAARDFRPALENYRKALAIREEAFSAASPNARARDDLSSTYADEARALAAVGDGGAHAALDKALTLAEEASAQSPANARLKGRLALRYFEAGQVDAQAARAERTLGNERRALLSEARERFQRSLDIWQAMRDESALGGAGASKLGEAVREIARCAAALAR